MSLAKQLNRLGVNYTATRGVCSLECCPPDELLNENGGYKNDTDAEFDARLEAAETFLDTHPEGSGGGYVCWVELDGQSAWFDEHGDNEWK